jgi:hypothetical protein
MSKLSKSHYQNGFLTGQRAAALAGIYLSRLQSASNSATGLNRFRDQTTNSKNK